MPGRHLPGPGPFVVWLVLHPGGDRFAKPEADGLVGAGQPSTGGASLCCARTPKPHLCPGAL